MRNKTTKKFGFTLAEMLIAMAIVGVSVIAAMTTMKAPKDVALKYLYMNAYTALAKAYYNGSLIGYNPFIDEKIEDLEPVHTAGKDSGTEVICRGLSTYINTNTNKKTAEHDYSTTCAGAATRFSSEMGTSEDFTYGKLMFTATNGMKFYITNRLGGNNDGDPYFYIVYIDVNGDNGPNSLGENFSPTTSSRSLTPDIFAFALLDTGKVCPLGIPEYDTEILTARFVHGEQLDKIYPRSLAYYQAKGAAWGYYSTNRTDFNSDEQFSMNDKIRSMIPGSNIVKNFPDLKKQSPMELFSEEASEGESASRCSSEDLESCYVFLDEYRR